MHTPSKSKIVSPPILHALAGNKSSVLPIWMMRQAGRHLPEYLKVRATTKSFIDFCLTPEKASDVTLQPIRRYDMDAAILFADILLIPLGLGRDVRFVKGIGPQLDPIAPKDISALKVKMAADHLSPVYETVSRVTSSLAADKTLIGFCGGAWTVATYMIEGQGTPSKEMAKRFAYNHSDDTDMLLEILARASAEYMINQAKAGAHVLKIFESWAEGLTPALFERLVIKPTQLMISLIREAGIKVPIICFPRGCGLNLQAFVDSIDCQGLAVGTDTPVSEALRIARPNQCLQGNLDPLALRIGGKALEDAVAQLLTEIQGPHIFNLGHGVSPDVKIENVEAVISHIRSGKGHYV